MPSLETIRKIRASHNVVSFCNDLRVFVLFVCPACKRYTIHAPRLNRKGYWYVDHKRVPVHQLDLDNNMHYVGDAPADACFVDDNNAILEIETTRAVIRVK